MDREHKSIGKLFDTIEIENEEHLEMIIQSMTKENALFIMTQAIKFAYTSGIYSIGEVEILSKCIRTLSKKEGH